MVLNDLLKVKKISKRQLAKDLSSDRGITYDTAKSNIAKWTSGKHVPNEENALALGRLLDAPVAQGIARGRAFQNHLLTTMLEQLATLEERVAALEKRRARQPAQSKRPAGKSRPTKAR
jgi:hypothetical protein